jgi:predicted nucleic acid-binding protein
MKILFDTCIIVDALQKREPFFDEARLLLLAAARESVEPFITAKSVSDVYYLMHRHFHDDSKTRSAIGKLLMTMSVLDTTGMDVQNALNLLSGDFEDGIMMATASRCGMDGIVTRNVRDFKQSAVKVYSPAELLGVMHD